MSKYRNTNVNKTKYKPKFRKFKLSHFISKHSLTISIILSTLFAVAVYATHSMYNNHYTDKSKNIDSVVSVVYEVYTPTPTMIPTIIPTVTTMPTRDTLPNRGGISRGEDRKSIVEPVVKDKKVDDTVNFKYVDSFFGHVTKYTLAYEECGGKLPNHPLYGITASGIRVKPNHTIATGKNIPFGSKVRIQGLDTIYTAEDLGGGIKWNCIDIYTISRSEAFEWGRQRRMVYIISKGNGKVK